MYRKSKYGFYHIEKSCNTHLCGLRVTLSSLFVYCCVFCVYWYFFISTQTTFYTKDIFILKWFRCCGHKTIGSCRTQWNIRTSIHHFTTVHYYFRWHFVMRSKQFLQILICHNCVHNRHHLLKKICRS